MYISSWRLKYLQFLRPISNYKSAWEEAKPRSFVFQWVYPVKENKSWCKARFSWASEWPQLLTSHFSPSLSQAQGRPREESNHPAVTSKELPPFKAEPPFSDPQFSSAPQLTCRETGTAPYPENLVKQSLCLGHVHFLNVLLISLMFERSSGGWIIWCKWNSLGNTCIFISLTSSPALCISMELTH